MIRIVYLSFFILFVYGCDQKMVYEQNKDIQDGWKLDQIINFNVDIKDTISNMEMFINIRHTSDYPFTNIWLFINTLDPQGQYKKDTVECVLAEKSGKWKGSGLGGIKFLRTKLKNIRFDSKGPHKIFIEQAMRHGSKPNIQVLPEIINVGIRLQKTNYTDVQK